ncbi:MAG: DUF4265 domain-containing protein [Acidobacteriota bacterium]
MSEDTDNSLKVYVDLPNHWATGGESLWARPLGNDLYELENVLFYAYGLNFLDVVKAIENQDSILEITEVIKNSGHRTLRIIVDSSLTEEDQLELLSDLEKLNVSFERANSHYLAIDVHPEADYDAVCDKLWQLQQQGLLGYETCEARVPNSFDALLEGDSG